MKELIQKLKETQNLSKKEWISLIENRSVELSDYLFAQAREVRHQYYGKEIYVRGLIEFTNYCKNDCFYCGIRKSNANTPRYRLTKEDILRLLQAAIEDENFEMDIYDDSTVHNTAHKIIYKNIKLEKETKRKAKIKN